MAAALVNCRLFLFLLPYRRNHHHHHRHHSLHNEVKSFHSVITNRRSIVFFCTSAPLTHYCGQAIKYTEVMVMVVVPATNDSAGGLAPKIFAGCCALLARGNLHTHSISLSVCQNHFNNQFVYTLSIEAEAATLTEQSYHQQIYYAALPFTFTFLISPTHSIFFTAIIYFATFSRSKQFHLLVAPFSLTAWR